MGDCRTGHVSAEILIEEDNTYISGFIHVDPSSIYVNTSLRAVESLKFGGPVPIIKG